MGIDIKTDDLAQKFKILSTFRLFWAILVICNPSGSKVRHTGWNFLGPQIALQMTCKGQIAEQNANEHVLAIAPPLGFAGFAVHIVNLANPANPANPNKKFELY